MTHAELMREKIADRLRKDTMATVGRSYEVADAILSLIREAMPKEKKKPKNKAVGGTFDWDRYEKKIARIEAHNACLADINKVLGGER